MNVPADIKVKSGGTGKLTPLMKSRGHQDVGKLLQMQGKGMTALLPRLTHDTLFHFGGNPTKSLNARGFSGPLMPL